MATDFNPGDPYFYVGGKNDEQPAKVHGKLPPKPIKTARGIAADVKHRLQVLEPVLKEYETLKKLDAILTGKPVPKPKPKRGARIK
jgi:hypothetical protein